ncbi:hypothetical protein [Streptomyces megasporus]|uniref:Mom family adenine methylcarbamoylation protein n=1 Tax=Streptomyces megasporus TaxID=44060 RepID=UPI00068E8B7B|nr:hypothetical protein [Streptomyces megasporus]
MSGMRQDALFDGDWAQRWSLGRHTWRHRHDGGFDPDRYEVVPLAEDKPVRAFLEAHHYLTGLPPAVFRYAMVDVRHPATGGLPGRMVGVMVLSVPMNRRALTNVFPGLEPVAESLDFSRLCLLDEVAANGESWFCAASFRHAAAQGVRGIVTFADPMPYRRRTAHGTHLITPGHAGVVYQALGFEHLGRSTSRTQILLPDGTALTARSAAKATGGEQGAAAVERRLVALGARARARGQSPRVWLAQALNEVGATRRRHPGCYRYALRIGRTRAERTAVRIALASLPYPKPAALPAALGTVS